jgi:hypothetical protein
MMKPLFIPQASIDLATNGVLNAPVSKIAALVVLLGLLGSGGRSGDGAPPRADPCALCADAKLVSCPTCAGKGKSALECAGCRGTGRAPCEACKLTKEVAAAIGVKIKAGWLPCPNQHCDKKGMVTWLSRSSDPSKRERDPCKVCDGRGTTRCPVCSEGAGPCFGCGGRGRLEGTCRDCAGSGKLPCPGCNAKATARSCPFCRNERKRPCELCKNGVRPGSETTIKCTACAGTGAKPCRDCVGLGRAACFGCGGTGKIRSEIIGTGEKAGKKKHDACNGAGYQPCESCKAGRVDCGACKGGSIPVKCAGCRDSKIVACHGCIPGTWLAFEACARILHGASRFEEAGAFYTAALQRVTGMLVNEDPEFPERKRAMDLWLKVERDRIESGAAAADQRKPPPSR